MDNNRFKKFKFLFSIVVITACIIFIGSMLNKAYLNDKSKLQAASKDTANTLVEQSEVKVESKDDILSRMQMPIGFANQDAVNNYAVKNGLLHSLEEVNDVMNYEKLAVILNRANRITEIPTVNDQKVDNVIVANGVAISNEVVMANNRGYFGYLEELNPESPVILNDLLSLIYRTCTQLVPFEEIADDQMSNILDLVDSVSMEDKSCRKNKIGYLYSYGLLPFTNEGTLPLYQEMTTTDVINILIMYMDNLDILYSNGIDASCLPCERQTLLSDRIG